MFGLSTIKKADISGTTIELRLCSTAMREPISTFGKAYAVVGASKSEVHIGLGRATFNDGVGKILLRPENFGANSLATTDAVFSILAPTYVDVTSSGTRRQAFAPEGLADVQVLGGGGFVIKFYQASQVGTKSGGIYPLTGSPFVTYEITDPDASGGTNDGSGNLIDRKEYSFGAYESYARGYSGDYYSVYDKALYTSDPANPYEVTTVQTGATTKTYRFTGANLITGEPETAIGEIKQVKRTFLNTVDDLITTYS